MALSEPGLYKSNTMLRRTMPIPSGVDTKLPFIFVNAGPLNIGDILDIRAHIQATNNNNNLTVAWNMYVTMNYYGIDHMTGMLDYSTGRNLLRDIHHDGLVQSIIHKATIPAQNAYIAICCTAKPLTSWLKGRVLNLDYGTLTVRKN